MLLRINNGSTQPLSSSSSLVSNTSQSGQAQAQAQGELRAWQLPPASLFSNVAHYQPASPSPSSSQQINSTANHYQVNETLAHQRAQIIKTTLHGYGMEVEVVEVGVGPTVTQYGLKPGPKVTTKKIAALIDDLALALAVESVRLEKPIPGKALIGIEVPNRYKIEVDLFKSVLQTPQFQTYQGELKLGLGVTITGIPAVVSLASLPHLLIGGVTGAGKSVCLNTLIISLLTNYTPDELRLVLIDTKRLELTPYRGISHLQFDVITQVTDNHGDDDNNGDSDTNTTSDTEEASNEATTTINVMDALKWAVGEMDRRYLLLERTGYRNIETYNNSIISSTAATTAVTPLINYSSTNSTIPAVDTITTLMMMDEADNTNSERSNNGGGSSGEQLTTLIQPQNQFQPLGLAKLPYVVIIIDELADLMLSSPDERPIIENRIARLAGKARAAGIHLIVATQRPSVDVITGLIKANFPARISFAVSTQSDSRVILDMVGAEKLLGRGDMLFQKPGVGKPTRLQGALVSDEVIRRVVNFWRSQAQVQVQVGSLLNNNYSTLSSSSGYEDKEKTKTKTKTTKKTSNNTRKPAAGVVSPSATPVVKFMANPLVLLTPSTSSQLVTPFEPTESVASRTENDTLNAALALEQAKTHNNNKLLQVELASLEQKLVQKDQQIQSLKQELATFILATKNNTPSSPNSNSSNGTRASNNSTDDNSGSRHPTSVGQKGNEFQFSEAAQTPPLPSPSPSSYGYDAATKSSDTLALETIRVNNLIISSSSSALPPPSPTDSRRLDNSNNNNGNEGVKIAETLNEVENTYTDASVTVAAAASKVHPLTLTLTAFSPVQPQPTKGLREVLTSVEKRNLRQLEADLQEVRNSSNGKLKLKILHYLSHPDQETATYSATFLAKQLKYEFTTVMSNLPNRLVSIGLLTPHNKSTKIAYSADLTKYATTHFEQVEPTVIVDLLRKILAKPSLR